MVRIPETRRMRCPRGSMLMGHANSGMTRG
jgi:hypothetical protein